MTFEPKSNQACLRRGPRAAGVRRPDADRGFQQVLVVTNGDDITITDLLGEILIEHVRPALCITDVGNARIRDARQDTSTATEVLTHRVTPMS
ncbi:hypothetical protein [Kribbella sp. NPDC004536]|uniref:hypothetical protein n=1 Tax=Kribbella sp. NPDC004536 TaxID=3364106 RepID=UPI00367B9B8C